MDTVAVLHINTGNDFTRFKTQIGFATGIHLAVADQFMGKSTLLQNLGGNFILYVRKNGGYSLLFFFRIALLVRARGVYS